MWTIQYTDEPELFAAEYSGQNGDVDFYAALARRLASVGPVLELGVGTGRIYRQLCLASASAWGVERSATMIAYARRVLGDARRVVQADCSALPFIGERFALIIAPFNLLNELTNASLEATLSEAMRVLAPGGVFAADICLPDPNWLAEAVPTWRRGHRFAFADENPNVTSLEAWTIQRSYAPSSCTSFREVAYVEVTSEGNTTPFNSRRRVRYQVHLLQRDELDEACKSAGFEIRQRLSDFVPSAGTQPTSYVIVCEKRKRAAGSLPLYP